MDTSSRIYVAGHRGLVGSALVRRLAELGYTNIVTKTHNELDLLRQAEVEEFFAREQPEYVFLAAARVGGILANSSSPAEFYYQNSMIANNVIHSAHLNNVTKLLFLGSSCIYPRDCEQPIKEDYLLTGALEPTNEAYAIAKIAGLKMCEYYKRQFGANFISCMPTNLYGPNDNFDLATSHVLPALLRKFHDAKLAGRTDVQIWGSGKPYREFLHVDDMADACIFLMENYDGVQHVNIGTGEEVSIGELALMIKSVVGFAGEVKFDTTKPDGTMKKLTDVSKLQGLGWQSKIALADGIAETYRWYVQGGYNKMN